MMINSIALSIEYFNRGFLKEIIVPFQLQLISQYFQKMIPKAASFTSFKKIINSTLLTPRMDLKIEHNSPGQLMIQSKIEEESLELGLESQKSKDNIQGVRSSIDSQQRKKQSNASIPLSQLILRDTGYDYLFTTKSQVHKMDQIYSSNIKELKNQTQQMIAIINLQLMASEESELKQKIYQLQRQIYKLKNQRKSKSPIQHNSQYLQTIGKKRKQRLSGRMIQLHSKQNRSNLKTQCDSKPPSLPSAPVTPISHNKLMLSPRKQFKNQYIAILKSKKKLLKDSISTFITFSQQRARQLRQQNNLIKQQISYLNSKIHLTPIRKTHNMLTQRNYDSFKSSSLSKNMSNRRLFGICSPRKSRQTKKNQFIRMIDGMKNSTRLDPREEYFLASH